MIDLSFNENEFGPSPKALEASVNAVKQIGRYPIESNKLIGALSAFYGIEETMIAIGNGSCDFIEAIGKTLVKKGEEVLFSVPAFMVYTRIAR